jgi:hypothetical protein
VYLRGEVPTKRRGSSELATWAKLLREAGVTVALEDTVGGLGPLGLTLAGDAAHLHPTIGYHGAASLAPG